MPRAIGAFLLCDKIELMCHSGSRGAFGWRVVMRGLRRDDVGWGMDVLGDSLECCGYLRKRGIYELSDRQGKPAFFIAMVSRDPSILTLSSGGVSLNKSGGVWITMGIRHRFWG